MIFYISLNDNKLKLKSTQQQDQVSTLQEPSRETHSHRHTRRKSFILQSFVKKIIRTVLSTGVFC